MDVKYPYAFYVDENKQWQKVSYIKLSDENERAFLRTRELYNNEKKQIYLGIRNRESKPHFYRKKDVRVLIEKGVDYSQKHKEIINFLLNNYLKKYESNKIKFGFYDKPWGKSKKEKGFDTIINVNDYCWEKEQGFGLIYGKYVVFDILGRSKINISLLDSNPYIAIEVIDTHFHSLETFRALLELSKNLPFIIVYYFINQYPKLNQPMISNSIKSPLKMRIYAYLYDGSFWIQKCRIEEDENVIISPDNINEYYELVKHRLIDNHLLRN